jgi:hypothetical protein
MKRLLIFLAGTLFMLVILFAIVNYEAISQGSWSKITFSIRQNFWVGPGVGHTAAFVAFDIADTVRIPGASTSDSYFLSAKQDSDWAALSYIPKADTLIVLRNSPTNNALIYVWLRVTVK